MENASKALLIAAGTLIGIMIISLGVYLFATFGSSAAEINKQNEETQTNNFNAQYTSYIGRTDLTIYDIVSVANKAKDNNTYYNLTQADRNDKTRYISVFLTGKGYLEIKTETDLNNLIKYDSNLKYTCTDVKISSDTKRVYQINFK